MKKTKFRLMFLAYLVVALVFTACNENENETTVIIDNIRCVTHNSALVEVVVDYGDYVHPVIKQGILLSSDAQPTDEDVINASMIQYNHSDSVVFQISNLEPGKTYYVRSFVEYEASSIRQ